MILGTGVDIVDVSRIGAALERYGARFAERVFTTAEIAYCDSKSNRAERYAARFAAKEAGLKAIGTGWRDGISWHDCEVELESSGRPTLLYAGQAREIAHRLGVKRAFLSLSHTGDYAIAHVVLEG